MSDADNRWVVMQRASVPIECALSPGPPAPAPVPAADGQDGGSAVLARPSVPVRRDDDSEKMIFSTPPARRAWFCLQSAWQIPRNSAASALRPGAAVVAAGVNSASTGSSLAGAAGAAGTMANLTPFDAAELRAQNSNSKAVPVNMRLERGHVSTLGRRGLSVLGFCPPEALPSSATSANGVHEASDQSQSTAPISAAATSATDTTMLDVSAAAAAPSALDSITNPAAKCKLKVSRQQVRVWVVSKSSVMVQNLHGTIRIVRGSAFRNVLTAERDRGHDPLHVPASPRAQIGEEVVPRLPRSSSATNAFGLRLNQDWMTLRAGEAALLRAGDVFTLRHDEFPIVVVPDETIGDADETTETRLRERIGGVVQLFRVDIGQAGGWCQAHIVDADARSMSLQLAFSDGVTEWRLESHVVGSQISSDPTVMLHKQMLAGKDAKIGKQHTTTGSNKRAAVEEGVGARRSQRARTQTGYTIWDDSDVEASSGENFGVSFQPPIRDPAVRVQDPANELFWNNEKPPTMYFYHPICLQHLVPPVHIEVPERLETILQTLRDLRDAYPQQLQGCDDFEKLSRQQLRAVHPEWYLAKLDHMVSQVQEGACSFVPHMSRRKRAECAQKFEIAEFKRGGMSDEQALAVTSTLPADIDDEDSIDPESEDYHDTFVSRLSVQAAEIAVSAVTGAINAVMTGRARNAFCAVRPPGHHCGEQGPGMTAVTQGFCLMNNVVLGAMYARQHYSGKHDGAINKIAIVDFDVHHGNGSEEILAGREGFLFCSIHVGDLYPNTGMGPGSAPNIINVSLPRKCMPELFQRRFGEEVIAAVERFQPDLLMISAGFDGHQKDPTEGMMLTETDYAIMTAKLKRIAATYCRDRMVSVLEGGYSLEYLKRCVAQHVVEMMRK